MNGTAAEEMRATFEPLDELLASLATSAPVAVECCGSALKAPTPKTPLQVCTCA